MELIEKKYAIYLLTQFNLIDNYTEGRSVYHAILELIDTGTLKNFDMDTAQIFNILISDIMALGCKKNPIYTIRSFEEFGRSQKRHDKIEVVFE